MKRKTIIKLAAIIAVASIIAGFTLAYLTDVTSAKTNTFTASNGISIKLAEPLWDNIDYDGSEAGVTAALGEDLADNIVPGRLIPKNPSVKNASDEEDIWVAIKITYTGDASTFALVDTFADIDFDTTNWEAKDTTYTVFYFKTKLSPGSNTSDLFTRVLIDSTAANGALKSFGMEITAYAVQFEGLTYEQAKTPLNSLMGL